MRLSYKVASLLIIFLTLFQIGFAQQKTVTGRVTDAQGNPLPGVSVIAKGSRSGTQTGSDGTYSLSVGNNVSALIFSSVGFGRQEVSIAGKSSLDVAMEAASQDLNTVVVIGYGTTRKKDATGSVAALGTKDFNKGVISTPEQLIQGRTPGVTVSPSSGEPGAASTINIRGTSSIRGNNDPLYVVDGVPLDAGGTSGNGGFGVEGSSTPKNPLMFLNPNDIESISILKDASSAAIYGSRGANGVILITTKNGRSPRGAFTFSTTQSVSWAASRYDLLNGPDFLKAVEKANIDAGTSPADAAIAVQAVDKGGNTDWQDEIFRKAYSQNYNLAWGFSKNATALRLSGSYDDQQGIVKNSGLKRLTGRANLTQKFFADKLRVDVTATYSNVKNQYAPNSNNAGYQGSLIGAAIAFNPTYSIYGDNGLYFDPKDGNRNPVEMLNYFDDRDNINRYLTNISGSYKILNSLTYKATFGYDHSKSLRKSFADPRLLSAGFGGTTNVFGVDYGNSIEGNGRAVYQDLKLTTTLVEHTLTYDKAFSNSNVNAVAGYSYQGTEVEGSGRVAWGLTIPVVKARDVFVKDINNFKNIKPAYLPFYTKTELQSFFGRVNYTISNKYLLTATVRSDGSSKFGTNNKYATFPAFAAKWKLASESFAENSIGKVFSDFSIRANWGKLGSQEGLDAYSAINLYETFFVSGGGTATNLTHQENKDLKWEEATTTGVGLDYATKSNRLSGTIDYYYTKRKNLIFFGPVPGGFSASSNYFSNLPGYVLNTGLEFSINYQVIKQTKFNWDINYNMTFQHNEMREFTLPPVNTGQVHGQGLSGAYAQTIVNGYPLFTWKMPVFEGFDAKGDAKYANGSNDVLLGSALPKFTAGLTNNFSLGKWNLSVFMNTSRGFYVYNNTANALFLRGSVKTAHNVTYAAANSNEDPINPGSVSTRFLEKGDFIRLSNAILSYTFTVKNKFIKSLSASLSGQNLFLITDYSGLDPEINVDENINGVPSRGFDYAGYPKARTISLGINLGF